MLLTLGACSTAAREASWPTPVRERAAEPVSADAEFVQNQPICVGASAWSAGAIGQTVLFHEHRVGRRLDVGYFVYWSEERPWGSNVLSYTVLPALATDAVYSHFFYLFPGLKDALYGPGDIEGVTVEFEEGTDGKLTVTGGLADDANHAPVKLTREDLVDAQGRIVLLTNVWSHQLGAHGAARFANTPGTSLQCYQAASVQPLTAEVARNFRLGTDSKPLRGGPAWPQPSLPEKQVPRSEVAAAKAVSTHQ